MLGTCSLKADERFVKRGLMLEAFIDVPVNASCRPSANETLLLFFFAVRHVYRAPNSELR